VWQLTQHGAAAVEALGGAVTDGSVKQRARAAEALLGLRTVAAPAASSLIKGLKWDPPTGQEGGPGELTAFRVNAWRSLAIHGGSSAAGLARSEIAKALRFSAVSDDGEVPGWIGAAVGCWLRQGGSGAERGVAKLALGALQWKAGGDHFVRALEDARHPGVLPVLTAVIDFEERDAIAMKRRNDIEAAKAERAKRDPPTPELSGPERMLCHEVLQRLTQTRNATAGAWLVWFKERGDWLYYSRKDYRIAVDEAAKQAGTPTDDYRREHPWAEGEGPDVPPYQPRFVGAIPRRHAGPSELPGEDDDE
jgi:hypothetical protein